MSFLSPYLALGLFALLVPLAIHLWNRKESKAIPFGTTKWLEEAQETKSSSIQFTDFWLFLLRCLLLVLFVFLLMKIFSEREIQIQSSYHKPWLLIQPSALAKVQSSLSDYPEDQYQHRYFSAGFPIIDSISANVPDAKLPWQLLESIHKMPQAPDSVILLSELSMTDLKGKKKAIPTFVKWQVLPLEKTHLFLLTAQMDKKDNITVLLGKSQDTHQKIQRFSFPYTGQQSIQTPEGYTIQIQKNERLKLNLKQNPEDKITVREAATIQVNIQNSPTFRKDAIYLKAALNAIAAYSGTTIQINPKKEVVDWLFLLGKEKPSETIQPRKGLITYQENKEAHLKLISSSKTEQKGYSLNRRLAKTEVETKLVEELIVLLLGDATWAERLDANDKRLPDYHQYQLTQQENEFTIDNKSPLKERDFFDFPIWLGIMTLFLLERILSIRRNHH